MIAEFRDTFNAQYRSESYLHLLAELESICGTTVEFRVAETPVFLAETLLAEMAHSGAMLTKRLIECPDYIAAARNSIPRGYSVDGVSAHPNFLTADFALIRLENGELAPRLVELQAFPSVFAYQLALNRCYADAYNLPASLQTIMEGLTEEAFLAKFRETILGKHEPENVVLTEVDPFHQKTLPDFLLTRKALGIPILDITTLIPVGNKLHYRNSNGLLVPIHRIYNRAIADEIMARKIELQFDLTAPWEVEWAGHPNWYFLISKFALPWLSGNCGSVPAAESVVPPAVFLDDFLDGNGFSKMKTAGVQLEEGPDSVYDDLLLKPLFSFAGKGIQFSPSRRELLSIPQSERKNYLLQKRMHFEPTIRTPHGMTQAEIRILYLWPEGGELTPTLSLVRLGRGKMMGVDHNRNQEWVGASAAFWI